MDAIDGTIFAAVGMLYAVLSARLGRTVVMLVIFFLTAGILLGDAVLGWFSVEADSGVLRLIAETTLALVLFSDASKINLGALHAGTRRARTTPRHRFALDDRRRDRVGAPRVPGPERGRGGTPGHRRRADRCRPWSDGRVRRAGAVTDPTGPEC